MKRFAALALAAGLLAACGGPTPSPTPPPASPPEAPVTPPKKALQVFDEKGQPSSSCPPAKEGCPEAAPPTAFLDRCRLSGFRVLQCGCEQRCTGDVSAAVRRYYDVDGQQKECVPARSDCTPPEPGSKFQDACSEHAFRLEVCGCEWLCSGNFRK